MMQIHSPKSQAASSFQSGSIVVSQTVRSFKYCNGGWSMLMRIDLHCIVASWCSMSVPCCLFVSRCLFNAKLCGRGATVADSLGRQPKVALESIESRSDDGYWCRRVAAIRARRPPSLRDFRWNGPCHLGLASQAGERHRSAIGSQVDHAPHDNPNTFRTKTISMQ
jgi:hypothetical protein